MKKLIPLLFILAIASSCVTMTRIQGEMSPSDQFEYPFVITTDRPANEVWERLVDVIAVEGYPIDRLDKENGLFVTGTLKEIPYTFQSKSGKLMDPEAHLVLPHIKFQETNSSGRKVRASYTLYPDTLSMKMNVRIRPKKDGGTFVNVNLQNIYSKGAHYIVKRPKGYIPNDTTTIYMPLAANKVNWEGTKSTGVLEEFITESIK